MRIVTRFLHIPRCSNIRDDIILSHPRHHQTLHPILRHSLSGNLVLFFPVDGEAHRALHFSVDYNSPSFPLFGMSLCFALIVRSSCSYIWILRPSGILHNHGLGLHS